MIKRTAWLAMALVIVGGCDSYSLLDQFMLNNGLRMEPQKTTVQRGETIALNPSGGVAPYSFAILAEDLFFSGTLGTIAGQSYTAGNSIGLIKLKASDANGNIAYAGVVIAPPPPTDFIVNAFDGNTITMTWLYSDSSLLSGFRIDRSIDGGAFTNDIAPLGSGATSYTDSSLNTTKLYAYRLYAVAGGYLSPATPTLSPP